MLVSATEMLKKAVAGKYAVGQFNINNLESVSYTHLCRREVCDMKARVCNAIGIVDGCHYFPGRISVIVVPEVLGY